MELGRNYVMSVTFVIYLLLFYQMDFKINNFLFYAQNLVSQAQIGGARFQNQTIRALMTQKKEMYTVLCLKLPSLARILEKTGNLT